MRTNTVRSKPSVTTHEGGLAASGLAPILQLRRTVSACLLWEDSFYEDGKAVGDRIASLVPLCKPSDVRALAVEARSLMNLRHVPLQLCALLAKSGGLDAETVAACVRRADEPGELLSLWRKVSGNRTTPRSIRNGIANALLRFDAYQLGKYASRKDGIRLRDVFRIVHPKPDTPERSVLWKSVIDGTLDSPDTWEVALSSGADKRETFTRLLAENKMGGLALLRNLRNMTDAKVDRSLVANAIASMRTDRVLPFRFLSAAKHAPQYEPQLDVAMLRSLRDQSKLPGRTVVLVDVSGSMVGAPVSAKSEIDRRDAACGLAILLREVCEDVDVFAFSDNVTTIPARHGFALADAIRKVPNGGTRLWSAVAHVAQHGPYDRCIVFTDEQAHDSPQSAPPAARCYMVNVATYQHGVAFGKWVSVSGFSESVVDFICAIEA